MLSLPPRDLGMMWSISTLPVLPHARQAGFSALSRRAFAWNSGVSSRCPLLRFHAGLWTGQGCFCRQLGCAQALGALGIFDV